MCTYFFIRYAFLKKEKTKTTNHFLVYLYKCSMANCIITMQENFELEENYACFRAWVFFFTLTNESINFLNYWSVSERIKFI